MERSENRWNVRIKTYPDGKQLYMVSEFPVKKPVFKKEVVHDGSAVEKKEIENQGRAIQAVYDLARGTKWDWFITLTFAPENVDRFDYDACAALVLKFTRSLRYFGCLYIIIPEQHKKGSWHFHGLVKGDLPVTLAINPKTGKLILDNHYRPVFNVANFDVGFTTATQIGDSDRTVSYITKYLTKDKMSKVPKGKKRYWASKGLPKPEVETYLGGLFEAGALIRACRYKKEIQAKYNRFFIGEV